MNARSTMIYNALPVVWLFGGPVAFALVTWALATYEPYLWQWYVALAFAPLCAHQSWILPVLVYSYFTEERGR